jgi:CubicO group peptidase (beta-lactamase class C family)
MSSDPADIQKDCQGKMYQKIISAITILILVCCFASGSASGKATPSTIQSIVNAVAVPLRKKNQIPGMAIGITLDGRDYFFNYGIASKETGKPVTRETLFEIGSLSKTFAAVLASSAQIQGTLSLHDSVSRYLPLLRGTSFDKITLLNLGTHTSGLPLFVPKGISSTSELMDYLKHWQPPFRAGTHRIYSNIGIGLLGAIAAKSRNETYEEALQNGLFQRLGMTHSYLNVPRDEMKDYAEGYTAKNAPVRMHAGVLAAEAYGVKSCAADLIRFLEENMGLIKVDARLQRAILQTHIGYSESEGLTQDLVWEQYAYPATREQLLAGNALVFKETEATRLDPALPPQSDVLIDKSGATSGFSAYVAFIPSKKIGIVMLANKAYPMDEEVTAAYRVLTAILSVTKVRHASAPAGAVPQGHNADW